ncbi:MAG: polynucleotide adenylyltransferase [Clostridia bacterium]|nr:polynucleotide adenylyltransferase [Clostridia bacterium]
MDIKFPEKVKKIIAVYEKNGYRAYAVGGCVRDCLMGKAPADWDITCSCSPEKTIEIFEFEGIHTIPTGLKHGTVSVLLGGEIFECTTHRVDGSYTDSRRPDFVEFTQRLEDDLSRRDFTVNAMAASPLGGVCDRFGGLDDLENKIIRCVGEPEVRFGEDALRILRALRFATVLDFEIEKETFSAVKKLAHTLENISAERKTSELSKILCSPYAQRGIGLLFDSGVIKYLLPDANILPQNITLLEPAFPLRLATFMWQSGGRDITRLRLSNEEKKTVSALLTKIELADTPEGARRMLSRYGKFSIFACILQGKADLAALVKSEKETGCVTKISQLAVDGNMLSELNIPNKKIGEVLSFLLDEVLKNPSLNTRDTLLQIANKKFNA